MRVAVILWATTGASGIDSEIRSLEKVGRDQFKIFISKPWAAWPSRMFPRQNIRQGDVYAEVDGKLSHHPRYVEENAKFLNENFDMVFFINGVPHPTKEYGPLPLFKRFMELVTLPKTMRICDGYADSYREWLDMGLELVDHATIAYSYRSTVNVPGVHIPFYPDEAETTRSMRPHICWVSQWKQIKSIKQFIAAVPDIKARIDMYSSGIEYFQMRKSPAWRAAVKKDHVGNFDGEGHAHYYGYTHHNSIGGILQHTWSIVDLQGLGNHKYKVYDGGSINTTSIEALYYGACPIVAMNSPIPGDLCLKVPKDAIAETINMHLLEPNDFLLSGERQQRAMEYVADTFAAPALYDEIMGI